MALPPPRRLSWGCDVTPQFPSWFYWLMAAAFALSLVSASLGGRKRRGKRRGKRPERTPPVASRGRQRPPTRFDPDLIPPAVATADSSEPEELDIRILSDEDIAVREGNRGESMVREVVKRLPSDRYCVLHDVHLPLTYGPDAQIDHIVVSPYGIFVIETKNWKGIVYGDAGAEKWTKYLRGQKMVLQNPLRQNARHVAAVKGIFESAVNDIVTGVVAMSPEIEFKGGVPSGVVYYNELSSWIYRHTDECIKPVQVAEIVGAIQAWAATTIGDRTWRGVSDTPRPDAP